MALEILSVRNTVLWDAHHALEVSNRDEKKNKGNKRAGEGVGFVDWKFSGYARKAFC